MGKPFAADIRIVAGGDVLPIGVGYANASGLVGKSGGCVPWGEVAEIRHLDTKAGGLAAGAIAGGGVGLLGGPPLAAAGALVGAVASTVAGATHLYALRHASGADLLIEISMLKGSAFSKAFERGRGASPPLPQHPIRQRIAHFLPRRTKGEG
jgi:hypothetical protein